MSSTDGVADQQMDESTDDTEIQVVEDADGVAVVGEPAAIDRFLATSGLAGRPFDLRRVQPALAGAAGVTKAASAITGQSGRWVKLTEESARRLKDVGAMRGSTSAVSRAVIQGKDGRIQGIAEFSKHASVLTSPAALAGISGLMTQMAMQQQMDDIAEYLAVIDEKVDDVLRAQKDAAVADMIGVDLVVDEAMTVRAEVGRVSDVTWSKVQSASTTLGRTQAYALRQVDALAEKLERKNDLGDLAKATRGAEASAAGWLAVIAHCFRLQEAVAVLELDRVLDASPEELEQHRRGLTVARDTRRALIQRSTEQLIDRMNAAAARANKRVLLNPIDSPAVVKASNRVAGAVTTFQSALGIEVDDQSVDARRWLHAAGDLKDAVVGAGAEGVSKGRCFGVESRDRARSLTNRVASGIAERTASRGRDEEAGE